MRWWHFLVFLVVLVVSALAFAPMQVFAPQKPGIMTYEGVNGSIWSARFTQLRLGPFPVGQGQWRLSPIDLVQGRLVGDLGLSGGAVEGKGRILANRRGDRRIAAQSLTLTGLPLGQAGLLPGKTAVTDLDITFQKGQCTIAKGQFNSDVFTQNRSLLGGFGPALSGQARCAGDAAEIPLAGREGETGVAILITLRANGAAQWRASVEGAKPEVVIALAAAGFRPDQGSGALTVSGDMTWLPF
jgi:hypothetical protein